MFLLAFISSGLIATSQLSSFLILLPCDLWQCYCCSWKDHRRGNWSKSRWKKKKKQRGRDFPPKVFELAHTNARISKELLLATTQPLLKKLLVDEARMVVLNSQALWSVLFTQYCKSWEEEGKRERERALARRLLNNGHEKQAAAEATVEFLSPLSSSVHNCNSPPWHSFVFAFQISLIVFH